jgi:hypothetical protein
VVAGHGEETGATCLYAVHDPESRRCRLTSAGHPPPAHRRPDGTTEFIDVPAGLMLGVGPSRYPAVDLQLPPGSVLALYTDGLIERPGQDIAAGMARLARALTASPARSLDDLCDSVLASLGDSARDDIALLLARTTIDDLQLSIKRPKPQRGTVNLAARPHIRKPRPGPGPSRGPGHRCVWKGEGIGASRPAIMSLRHASAISGRRLPRAARSRGQQRSKR